MTDATTISRDVVAQLVRNGITTFVLCPGSRSAPLAYALYDAEAAGVANLHVETDERVAGFVALGSGVAGKPAAVVTTSGSAVANLHPAVEEAFHSGVPLVVLSADRPHDIRGVRANQTTNHQAVLAGSVRYFVEIPAGSAVGPGTAGHIRRATRAATGAGMGTSPGPVHINLALREPLIPDSSWDTVVSDCEPREVRPSAKRTVVVAGPSTLDAPMSELLSGVPVLAEPSSDFRNHPNAMTAHPILLETSLRAEIERVVVVGHPTLTRDVSRLLADPKVEVLAVDEAPTYTDVSGNGHVIDVGDLEQWIMPDTKWLARWRAAARAADIHLEELNDLDWPAIARTVAQGASRVRTVVGASSIIREINLYGQCPSAPVHANRGLAGIDGTMSTAIGIATATGEPVRVALGDLTFIHDAGALIPTFGQSRCVLDVVVIDDSGGSLFATLEYGGGAREPYDRLFRTQKEFDFSAYAASVGVDFVAVTSIDHLRDLVQESPARTRIIHVDLADFDVNHQRTTRAHVRQSVRQAMNATLNSRTPS